MNLEITSLALGHVESAAELLARAFYETPAWVWAVPEGRRRASVLRWFYRAATRYALRHGEAHHAIAGEPLAVALVLPPERPHLHGAWLARAGLWQLPFRAGARAFGRFRAQGRVLDERHARDAPERHSYVWQLGVEPQHHGRGLGSTLLRSIAERGDRDGVALYLDTTEERNLVFYRRHGFEVVHEGCFPRGGCRLWTLVRPAAPRALTSA